MSEQADAPGRRLELDGIRGLAIVAVAIVHLSFPGLLGGFVGVDLFFALSGFLVAPLLWDRLDRHPLPQVLRHFWSRRARRLLPAALAGVVLALGLSYVVPGPIGPRTRAAAPAALTFLGNEWLPQGSGDHLLAHYWSLAVEAQFYVFLCVALVALHRLGARRRTVVGLLLCASLGVVVWRAHRFTAVSGTPTQPDTQTALYVGLDTHSDGLLLGAALGLALPWMVRRGSALLPRVAGWTGIGLLFVFLASWHLLDFNTWRLYTLGFPLIACLCAALVLAAALAAAGSPFARLLRTRPLQLAGQCSYGYYVLHFPVSMTLTAMLHQLPNGLNLARTLSVASSIALALGSWYLVERRWLAPARRSDTVPGDFGEDGPHRLVTEAPTVDSPSL